MFHEHFLGWIVKLHFEIWILKNQIGFVESIIETLIHWAYTISFNDKE